MAEPSPISEQATKRFPDAFGEYKASRAPRVSERDVFGAQLPDGDYGTISGASCDYLSKNSNRFAVSVVATSSENSAYSELKKLVADLRSRGEDVERVSGVGSLAYRTREGLAFFKGTAFVIIKNDKNGENSSATIDFARQFAQTIESPDSDIPSLVKHLPNWDQVEGHTRYAVSLTGLKEIIGDQPVLDAIDFSGGTEAVVAPYGDSQLAIVEFTTPQLATTNDSRVKARLEELKTSGQSIPSVYRRVGNYSVFVFNAPDSKTAENLISGITYEQVVQWLGQNPNILKRAEHIYAATTAGIVVSVVKASGLSLLICLGIGGLFGAYVFRQRRARLASLNTYSDAGGMVRLGIDDLNVQSDPGRLLERGER